MAVRGVIPADLRRIVVDGVSSVRVLDRAGILDSGRIHFRLRRDLDREAAAKSLGISSGFFPQLGIMDHDITNNTLRAGLEAMHPNLKYAIKLHQRQKPNTDDCMIRILEEVALPDDIYKKFNLYQELREAKDSLSNWGSLASAYLGLREDLELMNELGIRGEMPERALLDNRSIAMAVMAMHSGDPFKQGSYMAQVLQILPKPLEVPESMREIATITDSRSFFIADAADFLYGNGHAGSRNHFLLSGQQEIVRGREEKLIFDAEDYPYIAEEIRGAAIGG